MNIQLAHNDYLLRLADNALILGHRISEWCGHGPVLEQDIALTNLALDLIGQARMLYEHTAILEGSGRSEDDLAYMRDERSYRNVLLVEQPNGDFAHTIVRQFLYDVYNYYNTKALLGTKDKQLAAIAAKSLKEITYHLRYSSEWMIRLGDGTEESHARMQTAVDDLWMYSAELITENEVDKLVVQEGIGPDLKSIQPLWESKVQQIMQEATLEIPENQWMQKGGKDGVHSEYLGHILSELQYMQRAYPGLEW